MTIAMRPLSPAKYGLLFVVSCSALLAEAVLSFPFYFAPGWANGWPGGLTIYRVWSTWLTITLFVMLMTAGVGVASLISLLACIFPGGSRHSGKVLTILIAIWAILSVTTCSWAFSAIYSSTLEMGGEKGTGVINSRLNRADGTTELEAQRRSVQHGGT